MTDLTNQLFNAPWHVTNNKSGLFEIVDTSSFPNVATCYSEHDANRLSRLPELYDALAEAIREACCDCVVETELRTGMLFDPVHDGCIYPERDCCETCRGWMALLQKVRDGE